MARPAAGESIRELNVGAIDGLWPLSFSALFGSAGVMNSGGKHRGGHRFAGAHRAWPEPVAGAADGLRYRGPLTGCVTAAADGLRYRGPAGCGSPAEYSSMRLIRPSRTQTRIIASTAARLPA